MSELADLIRDAYEAFNRGDVDAILDLLHPDIEWVPTSLEPQPLRGREGASRCTWTAPRRWAR